MKTEPPVKFQSIKQNSVVDEIIETFKQMLMDGEIKPGQRLPSEMELTQQLGVGRSALREAMKIMQALGVVNIQQGNGTYVMDNLSSRALSPLVFALLLEMGMSLELVELRLMIETGYCELAAQHATLEDLERIEMAAQALEDYARLPDTQIEVLAELDLNFHRAILEATHNQLVIKIALAVEELFFASIQSTYASRPNNALTAAEFHRGIIDAIRDGRPEVIRAAVQESLIHWREEVKKLRD